MIIGFTGPMGVGKSTALKVLEEVIGTNNLKLVKFAAPLYDFQEYFYNRISSVYDRPKNFIKNRKLLQFIGSDIGRELDKDLWIKLWAHEALKMDRKGFEVVSDDVRFDNEAEKIKDLSGVIIKLTSSTIGDRNEVVRAGITGHQSENGINEKYIDFTIDNSGTLEEFKLKLHSLFKEKLLLGRSKELPNNNNLGDKNGI